MFEKLFSKSGLSLERLRSLCEIAEVKGMSEAARGSPSKQSQYSKQLKELESYFSVKLLDRKKKSMTEAGRRLLETCKPFLISLEKLSADLSGSGQNISIGAGQAVLDWVLFPQITELAREFPRITWSIKDFDSREIAARLLDFDLDFGILRREACQTERALHFTPLGTMTFALFVPRALQVSQPVPVATLGGSEQFTPIFERVSKIPELNVIIKLRCQSFPSVKALVKTGQFGGMLPLLARREMMKPEFEIIKHRAFKELSRNYVLAANRKNLSMRELERVEQKLGELCCMH